MIEFIPFNRALPTARHADRHGNIELKETNGKVRIGMWDWIPPTAPNAAQQWINNGFTGWRPTND